MWTSLTPTPSQDCSTLEKSSLIPFTFWKATVDQLVSEDTSRPTAILHYVQVISASLVTLILGPE